MGVVTMRSYVLEAMPERIHRLRDMSDGARAALMADGSSGGELEWSEHVSDLKALSMRYPGEAFVLMASDQEDIVMKRFRDGRQEFCGVVSRAAMQRLLA
jgi:hypothetical protein